MGVGVDVGVGVGVGFGVSVGVEVAVGVGVGTASVVQLTASIDKTVSKQMSMTNRPVLLKLVLLQVVLW